MYDGRYYRGLHSTYYIIVVYNNINMRKTKYNDNFEINVTLKLNH